MQISKCARILLISPAYYSVLSSLNIFYYLRLNWIFIAKVIQFYYFKNPNSAYMEKTETPPGTLHTHSQRRDNCYNWHLIFNLRFKAYKSTFNFTMSWRSSYGNKYKTSLFVLMETYYHTLWMYLNLFEQCFITDICSLQFSAFTYNALLNCYHMQKRRNVFGNNT